MRVHGPAPTSRRAGSMGPRGFAMDSVRGGSEDDNWDKDSMHQRCAGATASHGLLRLCSQCAASSATSSTTCGMCNIETSTFISATNVQFSIQLRAQRESSSWQDRRSFFRKVFFATIYAIEGEMHCFLYRLHCSMLCSKATFPTLGLAQCKRSFCR